MKTILTIIGARPQIIKAAAVSRAIREHFKNELKEIIVHTGQHYDDNMSQVFIDQLGIPQPDENLSSGSGAHGKQTAFMLQGIEEMLEKYKPNALLIYGDTNSTLAGAIAASKIHIPVVHVEAGLRSFNKKMPEEINRICSDHVSTLLFSPTSTGLENLKKEGFNPESQPPYSLDNPKVYHSGDVMYDNSLHYASMSDETSTLLEDIGLTGKDFILSTVHRPSNTDDKVRLKTILSGLLELAEENKTHVVLPLHPRTKAKIEMHFSDDGFKDELDQSQYFKFITPCGFLDMIALEKNCSLVMTDSGGVQKEAFFFEKPCLVFRPQTEWVEIINSGCGQLVDADSNKMKDGFNHFMNAKNLEFPNLYGNGQAAKFICQEILNHL